MSRHLSTSRSRRWPASLLALCAVAAVALSACSSGSGGGSSKTNSPTGSGSTSTSAAAGTVAPSTSSSSTTAAAVPTKTVNVTSVEGDGDTYGVGMPIVLRFTPSPTDSAAFTKAAKVTVNGQPANGAWYWEQPYKGQPIEAHYRPRVGYWPAHANIKVDLPIGGLSAGKGLAYSGKLTSVAFSIGDAHVSTVNGTGETMNVTSNGKLVKTIKVSLGKAKTPTYTGTKVVMQKGEDTPGTDKLRPSGAVRMIGPGYDEIVNWSVRITTSGEYVHAAPWNSQIGQVSTSNGCTNLSVADAKWFYGFSQIGDVVTYANTGGTKMPSWDGYGDWNVPWALWAQGGLLINH